MDVAVLLSSLLGVAVGSGPLPDDFIPETITTEHLVHENL
jgi:hypothetical protein